MDLQDMALVEDSLPMVQTGLEVAVHVPEDYTLLVPAIDDDVGRREVERRR
jgi:hypothetical protein